MNLLVKFQIFIMNLMVNFQRFILNLMVTFLINKDVCIQQLSNSILYHFLYTFSPEPPLDPDQLLTILKTILNQVRVSFSFFSPK